MSIQDHHDYLSIDDDIICDDYWISFRFPSYDSLEDPSVVFKVLEIPHLKVISYDHLQPSSFKENVDLDKQIEDLLQGFHVVLGQHIVPSPRKYLKGCF